MIKKIKYRIVHKGIQDYHHPWFVQKRQWFLIIPWWGDVRFFRTSEEAAEYIDKLKSVEMMNKYI